MSAEHARAGASCRAALARWLLATFAMAILIFQYPPSVARVMPPDPTPPAEPPRPPPDPDPLPVPGPGPVPVPIPIEPSLPDYVDVPPVKPIDR